MPPIGPALGALIQANVNSRMTAIADHSPLAQPIPSYYIEFCQAIGIGIIQGGPTISFVTEDSGSAGDPAVSGIGTGIGIISDPTFFVQDLYVRTLNYILADFGKTLHDPYPPSPGNSGEYLLALCEGINDSISSYYPAAWTLASVHPDIYAGTGTISNGQFTGLSDAAIKAAIIAGAPNFIGVFWPRLAQAISESYVALIEEHSTGTVTISGSCVPGPSQVCGIGGSGSGTGAAT